MRCPNCSSSFVLRADYAGHVRRCAPVDCDPKVTNALLKLLNEAAARLHSEFDLDDVEAPAKVARLHPAA